MSSMASFSSLIAAARVPRPTGPAAEFLDDRLQQPAIDLVESALVHLEQRRARRAPPSDVIARRRAPARSRAPAAAAGSRCAACRGLRRAISPRGLAVDRHAENPRRPPHDLPHVGLGVEVQPLHDAEAAAQRRGEQAGARRGADQREPLQRHLDRPRARPLPDHDVELVVLHRRIEDLLDRRRHAVDLVDEQDFPFRRFVSIAARSPGLLEHRPGGRAHRTPSSLAMT